ncbi:hypothetical protein [Microcystis phage MJing1]|nr:hypothetical protein [Microcystis phage MJing1]
MDITSTMQARGWTDALSTVLLVNEQPVPICVGPASTYSGTARPDEALWAKLEFVADGRALPGAGKRTLFSGVIDIKMRADDLAFIEVTATQLRWRGPADNGSVDIPRESAGLRLMRGMYKSNAARALQTAVRAWAQRGGTWETPRALRVAFGIGAARTTDSALKCEKSAANYTHMLADPDATEEQRNAWQNGVTRETEYAVREHANAALLLRVEAMLATRCGVADDAALRDAAQAALERAEATRQAAQERAREAARVVEQARLEAAKRQAAKERLEKAAPRLLAALEGLLATRPGHSDARNAAIAAAERAIAEAKGEG